MTMTPRLIPLRPSATESSSQFSRTTQSVGDSIEPISTFGAYTAPLRDESRSGFLSNRKDFDSPGERSTEFPDPRKIVSPDQEFFSLSALFSPLRDSFAVIDIASDMGARTHVSLSYLPSVNSAGGVGQYKMNTLLVQGLIPPTGIVLDCHL